MSDRKLRKQQKIADWWNADHPVFQPVLVREECGCLFHSTTLSPARVVDGSAQVEVLAHGRRRLLCQVIPVEGAA